MFSVLYSGKIWRKLQNIIVGQKHQAGVGSQNWKALSIRLSDVEPGRQWRFSGLRFSTFSIISLT